jgi:restriction system protein
VESLRAILAAALLINDTISFDDLRLPEETEPLQPPTELTTPKTPPRREDFLKQVRPLSLFERLFSRRRRYERELAQADARFAATQNEFEASEASRQARLAALKAAHAQKVEQQLARVRQRNAEVDELSAAYRDGQPSAVMAYCCMVLERSSYPEGFPQEFRLAYLPEPKELVIDYELPTFSIVPRVAEYRYVKSKDVIDEKARKASDIKDIYQEVVAAVALRTIHEVLEADQGAHLSVVVFNGFVNGVDSATGQDVRPYLISVRTTKKRFAELDLSRIEKRACLRNLGAQVSPQPTELQAVKPLIEFDMVDRRFVEGSEMLSALESRPNLMDLSPFEFEQLVGNLFGKMGLETKQTRSSRDGGVDVVAFDTRPLIGGKVVIQAKRYRHTVGVSAVRDLFGTMNHEGANKGILVTTSSYGPDAYDFIRGKPIELIDGGGLLYYLETHADVKARIVFPIE